MISIPKSRFESFIHFNKAKRWGQAFCDYMKLYRSKDDTSFITKLYNETDTEKAKNLVRSRLDHNS